MINSENSAEFTQDDAPQLIQENHAKLMRTLEILMNQVNMMFCFEKIKIYLSEKPEKTLEDFEKLIQRCIKVYVLIDNLIKIFKLIALKEKLEKELQSTD